jgi:hypothetical protein|tara:strand:+ start:990 stop:1835 length:846 start_codon:yes stop_codon:yes gene_type:complete
MAFLGFTEVRHKDEALNGLEARVKDTFDEISKNQIIGGRLLSGLRLSSTATNSSFSILSFNDYILRIDDVTAIEDGSLLRVQTSTAFREGVEGVDWHGNKGTPGWSGSDCATSIATYFNSALTDISATAVDTRVEFLSGSSGVLQNVSLDATAGFDVRPINSSISLSSVNAASFWLDEYIRFGPSSLSTPSNMLPGVSKILSKSDNLGGAGVSVFVDGLPGSMKGDLCVYKLIRNSIPGAKGNSRCIVLSKNRPSNIWIGAGGGGMNLFCDNDCVVDLWVF